MTQYPSIVSAKSLSLLGLAAMKQRAEKISCLTAYDSGFREMIDNAGVVVMRVGDS